jgi:hypothetical protein
MGFDQSRVRRPEWVVGAGGLLLLTSTLLLPWFQLTQSSGPPGPKYFIMLSVDGWHGLRHAHWLLAVTILAAFALVFVQATRQAPAVPVTASVMACLLGGLSALWLIYRVVIDPAGGREIGGWIGLLGACAIAYGGYASLRLEGIARADGPTEIPTVNLGAEGHT